MPIKDPIKRATYHKIYMKEIWYPANKTRQKAASLASKKKVLKFIQEWKVEKGCVDCGYNKHYAALDFDHLSEDKLFNLGSSTAKGAGMKRVTEEIAKCEVVCANCHRIRTITRRGTVLVN